MSESQELASPFSERRLERSWYRPDTTFFAAGACHVLAASFLKQYPNEGFSAYLIEPAPGYRGSHVFVARDDTAFDWKGYRLRADLEHDYVEMLRSFFGNWRGRVVPIDDPISWSFCTAHRHRHPSQFYRCPLERASRYLRRFPRPRAYASLLAD